jgi:hypothetical protein
MKHLVLVVGGLCVVFFAQAQKLTGIWRGSFYNVTDVMMGGSKYRYEVQIDDGKKPINGMKGLGGVTYSYQNTRFYAKAAMEGVWTPSSSNVVLRETKMEELRVAGGGDGCLMTCYLDYRKDGDKEYLQGTYTSVNMRSGANCGGGKVFLEKVPDSDFELEPFLEPQGQTKAKVKPGQEEFLVKTPAPKTEPAKTAPTKPKPAAPPVAKAPPVVKSPAPVQAPPRKENPVKLPPDSAGKMATAKPPQSATPAKLKVAPPPVLVERANELFESIETDSKVLTISFYDNGEVDGDIISVYDNNRLIASKKALSTNPIVVTVQLDDEEPVHEIVMVAENLGSIPPNTALMIVQAGSERYNVRLSSTEQKNAMVRFKYKP